MQSFLIKKSEAFASLNVLLFLSNFLYALNFINFVFNSSICTLFADVLYVIFLNCAINSERDFRKTQQKISNNIENSLQMIA